MFRDDDDKDFHMIYIASCGEGINAYHLVQSILVQFPNHALSVVKVPHIRSENHVDELMEKVIDTESLVVHTIVNSDLRKYITRKGIDAGIVTIDLMGPVISKIEAFLNKKPLEKPGLYRQIHQVNLTQVTAIEFALAQDDGVNPENLPNAEVILVGLSRAGKTPLSMYMSVMGWKVANVPFVPNITMPKVLDKIDRRRIIALDINPDQLFAHRKMRHESLGITEVTPYALLKDIKEEIAIARKYFISKGYSMIEVSNKPIETSAEEIIEVLTRRFRTKAHIVD
jgi:[pyruvate, water dikinase]-phosphate phosphotransferase / [pyruvate, water dikinase] kinase